MREFSIAIKWLALPLFMPFYALLLAMYVPNSIDYETQYYSLYHYPPQAKLSLMIVFLILSCIAPASSYFIMSRRGMIASIDMRTQFERRIPIMLMFVYCCALYAILLFLTRQAPVSKFVFALPLSGMAVSGVIWLINFRTKVSLHGAGVGILAGFIFAYGLFQLDFQVWQYYAVILFSGLVLSTRLYLHAHTPTQVFIGWTVGFVLTFIINFFYPGISQLG